MHLLDPTPLAAQFAWSPVHLAQAVENRAADAELGIRSKLHMFPAVKLVQRINQANYACMHEIFQRDMARQPLMDAARQISNLRQLFQQDAITILAVLPCGVSLRGIFVHIILSFFV